MRCRLCWNATGSMLASASDDHSVLLWSFPAVNRKPLHVQTQHMHNIFGVAFLPGDEQIVTGELLQPALPDRAQHDDLCQAALLLQRPQHLGHLGCPSSIDCCLQDCVHAACEQAPRCTPHRHHQSALEPHRCVCGCMQAGRCENGASGGSCLVNARTIQVREHKQQAFEERVHRDGLAQLRIKEVNMLL